MTWSEAYARGCEIHDREHGFCWGWLGAGAILTLFAEGVVALAWRLLS